LIADQRMTWSSATCSRRFSLRIPRNYANVDAIADDRVCDQAAGRKRILVEVGGVLSNAPSCFKDARSSTSRSGPAAFRAMEPNNERDLTFRRSRSGRCVARIAMTSSHCAAMLPSRCAVPAALSIALALRRVSNLDWYALVP
jgi:hypothetical protein